MPELPEAEVVARELRASIVGAILKDCWVGRPDIVRHGLETIDWYRGGRVVDVERRGKSVALAVERGEERRYLVAELGMTGLLLFRAPDQSYQKHTHLVLTLEAGWQSQPGRRRASCSSPVTELRYWNPRRFGRVHLVDMAGFARYSTRRFGCDPLTVTPDAFISLIKARRGRIKALLLHQQRLAGIGNIYANEILYRAGVHPHAHGAQLSCKAISRLYHAMQTVLNEAIAADGSSIRDFLTPNGTTGRFQERHQVYNKAGLPCPAGCGRRIKRLVTERSSFFCPHCQRR
jgi:formamidopyrimidine-DNA glycosylase